MKGYLVNVRIVFLHILLLGAVMLCAGHAVAATGNMPITEFPPDLQSYNDAGQSIIKDYFKQGVSPLGLLKGALVPTFIMFAVFFIFR